MLYLIDQNIIDYSVIEKQKNVAPSVLLDDHGNEFFRFEQDKREPISFKKIPKHLIEAFVAAEDHDFFNHFGISVKGIIRSSLINLYRRKLVQGASTITQQLARLLFLSPERTWYRKIRELIVAFQLEQQLTKSQILELYLNNIYFGRGIYGVEAASRRFWGKTVAELTLEQAATLAAVAKSARFYSPLNAPLSAKQRRNVILRSMNKLGIIKEQECICAQGKELGLIEQFSGNPIRFYLYEWIRQWAENSFGKDVVYGGGLKIRTTINMSAQDAAEKSFVEVVAPMREKIGNNFNGGLIACDVSTGQIKAMIGGFDFKQSQYNRAFQSYRQMGSSFKPILYSYALNCGIEMRNTFVDEPITIDLPNNQTWSPRNWNRKFEGEMTLIRALAGSNNIVSIKLLMKVGIDSVCSWAKRFGIHKNLLPYPSLALGIAESTVEENAAAFNVFANNGRYIKPTIIESVQDVHGKKIWRSQFESRQVLSVTRCCQMVNALSYRMKQYHRNNKKNWINAQTIGKSGSTNGAASVWFVGSTPSLTTAVYLGFDDNKPLGGDVFASKTAFPIWLNFNRIVDHPIKNFYQDPKLHEVQINSITGKYIDDSDEFCDTDVVTILE